MVCTRIPFRDLPFLHTINFILHVGDNSNMGDKTVGYRNVYGKYPDSLLQSFVFTYHKLHPPCWRQLQQGREIEKKILQSFNPINLSLQFLNENILKIGFMPMILQGYKACFGHAVIRVILPFSFGFFLCPVCIPCLE
ncbi:MAG: hypothetical protein JWR09_1743 [Mucilaginibacter sp.]|nr:hypothetical protein [Mucilaginibacter sp.]